MRSVLLVAAIALMSGAALATAQVNDNLPLSFHCGEAFITIHRTHIFNGTKTQEANGFLTIRKAEVDYVNLWTANGTTHVHIGLKGQEEKPTFVPKAFHRSIVECLN